MSKLVILNLGKGNLDDGFPFVTARLQWHEKNMQFTGSLPPAPELLSLYRRWQLLYELLYRDRAFGLRNFQYEEDITIDSTDITHISVEEFSEVCQDLENNINDWLEQESFRHIDRQIRKQLLPEDEIRFVIQTEDNNILKLPWYIWQFFQDYPKAEVSLSSFNFEQKKQSQNTAKKVRILAILGDSTGIDIKTDLKLLKKLPDAEMVFLIEPKREEFTEQLWEGQGWDILFFAGHSSTQVDGESGQIYINSDESLTIPQLKNALNKAIERGLQIAIFNSCEGLGLARQLGDLHIPHTIVMREPVPDKVAQEFLKHFLKIFSEGQSFYLAVREARERLQGIEGECPGASWLPVIFQNPAEESPTWKQLQSDFNPNFAPVLSSRRRRLSAAVINGLAVTTVVMGLRWLGMLQGWELKAFDSLMRSRPPEPADSRILIVGASEEDIGNEGYGYPLPDDILAKLFDRLEQYEPAAIGIDIFRDVPVPNNNIRGHLGLVSHLEQNQDLIAVCAGTNSKDSVAPPSEIAPEQVGFADLYDDKAQTKNSEETVRRYLLSRTPNPVDALSSCTTPYSFAWQLAYRYLQHKSIPVETVGGDWKFGGVIFQRLSKRNGGYQNLDARGNQLLINYRNTSEIAQKVNIKDILENHKNFNPAWVKDRVVLVGITAPSVPDVHDTPYGRMRGLDIHAHIISQIFSAVEENRALIWWLPQWGDTLWVFSWAFIGGAIAFMITKPLYRRATLGGSILVLYGTCWLFLIRGGWIPLVPPVLALLLAGGAGEMLQKIHK